MPFFDPEARQLLKRINLSCPMSEKDERTLALYKKKKLQLSELAKELPITAATIYSVLQDGERKISQSTIVRAFGGTLHLKQTEERLQNQVIVIKGTVHPFLEFLASKSIYIDSEENQAALTLIDTLIVASVEKIKNVDGRKRARLLFENNIIIENAAIPREIEGFISNQEILTHYGTIILPLTPPIQEAVNKIREEQRKSPIFQETLARLAGKLIDCTNFCPSKEERGMNLTAYSEARM